jgi:hypothetical protein
MGIIKLFKQYFKKELLSVATNGNLKPLIIKLEMLNAIIKPPQLNPTIK